MEIEIRPGILSVVLAVSAIIILGLVGYQSSPRDEAGRPVLLLPDVRAVELYRRDAIGWTDEWRVISQDLEEVLANDDMSLLARSRQAQRAFDRAAALARDVDAAEAPPALLGLHELSVSTSGAYVEAGAAIARWLSAPSDENQVTAEEALANAKAALSAMESNVWIAPLDEDAPE